MVAQIKTCPNATADEVVDVRLLMLELLEVSVDISDILHHTPRWYKRFSPFFLPASIIFVLLCAGT
jgi:hypothetical protein